MGRRIDIQADDICELLGEGGSLESLKCRQRCGLRPWAFQIAWTVDAATPATFAIARSVQWGRLMRRRLLGQADDLGDALRRDRRFARRTGPVAKQSR